VGGSPDVINITLSLDDEAPDSGPIIGGTFKPTDVDGLLPPDEFPSSAPSLANDAALSGFDRLNPNGTWSLYVYDDFSGLVGEFAGGWSLKVKAKVKR
jgi:hypothetical protein